tara:strand:+ start:164 stop:709 length:546 start_codon:yes stop_codon:yes gene_type:complete
MLERVKNNYTYRVEELDRYSARALAGDVFELLIDDVIGEIPNLTSLKNDYVTSTIGRATQENIQVDRHIRNSKGKLRAAIEAKTYLDASMCERAVVDFFKISLSQSCNKRVKFMIVVGQISVSENSLALSQAMCKALTGRNFEIFIVNKEKRRTSRETLWQYKFPLDFIELSRFHKYMRAL